MFTSTPRSLVLLLVAVPLATSCQRPRESPDAYAASVAVQRYNQRLLEAFRASRADLLADVAGPGEVSRVSAIVAGLTAEGRHMEARQIEFTPVSVHADGPGDGGARTVTVRSRERWSYEHRGSGGETLKQGEASYRMIYTVVQEQDRWVVERAAVEPE